MLLFLEMPLSVFINFIFESSYPPQFGFATVFTDTSRDIIIFEEWIYMHEMLRSGMFLRVLL